MDDTIEEWAARALKFKAQAQQIFSGLDSSKYRVMSVEGARKELKGLSIRQEELFDEAIGAVSCGLYRSAHVMSWGGFIDFLEQKMGEDGLVKVKAAVANGDQYKRARGCASMEEIRKKIDERSIIDLARDIGLIDSDEDERIQAKLRERNKAGHPERFRANLDTTLGYIHSLFLMVEDIKDRHL